MTVRTGILPKPILQAEIIFASPVFTMESHFLTVWQKPANPP